jgi:hypothetical protein
VPLCFDSVLEMATRPQVLVACSGGRGTVCSAKGGALVTNGCRNHHAVWESRGCMNVQPAAVARFCLPVRWPSWWWWREHWLVCALLHQGGVPPGGSRWSGCFRPFTSATLLGSSSAACGPQYLQARPQVIHHPAQHRPKQLQQPGCGCSAVASRGSQERALISATSTTDSGLCGVGVAAEDDDWSGPDRGWCRPLDS